MALKREFELEWASKKKVPGAKISIIGEQPGSKPYVSINAFGELVFIPDRDLERFAVNILKALNSKKLASYTDWKPLPRKKLKP